MVKRAILGLPKKACSVVMEAPQFPLFAMLVLYHTVPLGLYFAAATVQQ